MLVHHLVSLNKGAKAGGGGASGWDRRRETGCQQTHGEAPVWQAALEPGVMARGKRSRLETPADTCSGLGLGGAGFDTGVKTGGVS